MAEDVKQETAVVMDDEDIKATIKAEVERVKNNFKDLMSTYNEKQQAQAKVVEEYNKVIRDIEAEQNRLQGEARLLSTMASKYGVEVNFDVE
jgi:archaellum component FlaC